MRLKNFLFQWSGEKINKIRALLRKEFLIYFDQKIYFFAGFIFQIFLIFSLLFASNFFKDIFSKIIQAFSISYLQYSYLILLLVFVFSSVSGFLPNRLLQELETKNLTAYLLMPSSFFIWVLSCGIFGILINIAYFCFLILLGSILFKLNFLSSLFLLVALGVVFIAVFGLGFFISAFTLIFRKAYLVYNFLENFSIFLIAFLLPWFSFSGIYFFLKITPYYLIFKLISLGLNNNFEQAFKFFILLFFEAIFFWVSGFFLLNFGFNLARKKGYF